MLCLGNFTATDNVSMWFVGLPSVCCSIRCGVAPWQRLLLSSLVFSEEVSSWSQWPLRLQTQHTQFLKQLWLRCGPQIAPSPIHWDRCRDGEELRETVKTVDTPAVFWLSFVKTWLCSGLIVTGCPQTSSYRQGHRPEPFDSVADTGLLECWVWLFPNTVGASLLGKGKG